jgi:hypothetical protein
MLSTEVFDPALSAPKSQILRCDPHGTFKEALHRAFLHSAASAERFVHVNFRREKLDPDAFIPGLIEKNYGAYHDLTEAQVSRQTLLPNAPRWGWSWSAER